MYALKNVTLYQENHIQKEKTVVISGDKIIDIHTNKKSPVCDSEIDAQGHILVPGFIDIQVNGGGGILFNDNLSGNALKNMVQAHVKFGTTSILPTLITDTQEKMGLAIACTEQAIKNNVPGILGLHLEGPFLNKEKKGIHNESCIRQIQQNDINIILSSTLDIILITLAPEKINSQFISLLHNKKNIHIFAGHTNATYKEMQCAMQNGVKGITHLFNACSNFTGREPGVVGSAFLNEDCYCIIIGDGIHVSYESLRLLFQVKKINKCILVSDSMSPIGTNMTQFRLSGKEIYLKNNTYIDAAGTLAGAHLTVYQAFKNMIENKLLSIGDASEMSSLNAAKCLQMDHKKGRILPGFDADLVLLDQHNLDILNVIQAGKMI